MTDVKQLAEKLANLVILNEEASNALNRTGFVKLADNPWLAPLVGTGLGAVGGGLAGYLSSPEIEDERDARKRMLIGALTGGGLGGALGLGVNALGNVDPSKQVPDKKYEDIPSKLPWADRAGIALDVAGKENILHKPNLPIDVGLAVAGGVGSTDKPIFGAKDNRNRLGGVGRMVQAVGETAEGTSPTVGKINEEYLKRQGAKTLLRGDSPIREAMKGEIGGNTTVQGVEQGVRNAQDTIKTEQAIYDASKKNPSNKLRPTANGRSFDETIRDTAEVENALRNAKGSPHMSPVWDMNERKQLGAKTPNSPVLVDRLDPAIVADPKRLAQVTAEVDNALAKGVDHPFMNPIYAENHGVELRGNTTSTLMDKLRGRTSTRENLSPRAVRNRVLTDMGTDEATLLSAVNKLKGTQHEIKTIPQLAGFAARHGLRLPLYTDFAALLGAGSGSSMYNLHPIQSIFGKR